jgi:hypothetical protein
MAQHFSMLKMIVSMILSCSTLNTVQAWTPFTTLPLNFYQRTTFPRRFVSLDVQRRDVLSGLVLGTIFEGLESARAVVDEQRENVPPLIVSPRASGLSFGANWSATDGFSDSNFISFDESAYTYVMTFEGLRYFLTLM